MIIINIIFINRTWHWDITIWRLLPCKSRMLIHIGNIYGVRCPYILFIPSIWLSLIINITLPYSKLLEWLWHVCRQIQLSVVFWESSFEYSMVFWVSWSESIIILEFLETVNIFLFDSLTFPLSIICISNKSIHDLLSFLQSFFLVQISLAFSNVSLIELLRLQLLTNFMVPI